MNNLKTKRFLYTKDTVIFNMLRKLLLVSVFFGMMSTQVYSQQKSEKKTYVVKKTVNNDYVVKKTNGQTVAKVKYDPKKNEYVVKKTNGQTVERIKVDTKKQPDVKKK